MGVPLSNYTILQCLAEGVDKEKANLRSIEMDYALDALKNYSVFAFILHDPNIHKDFHELLGKQFRNLHRSSGEHLVFFGLVDSPKNYCLTGNQPFYADVREAFELMEENQGEDEILSYSAFAVANSLNIKPEMLPVIVITHDPRLSTFRWYRTCPDKLESQMSRLNGISYDMNDFKQIGGHSLNQNQEILYKLLEDSDLDLCKGMGTSVLNESMARALSDLLGFLIQSQSNLPLKKYNDRQAVKISNTQTRITLDKAIKSLNQLSKGLENVEIQDIENTNFFSIIEELNIKIATYLTLLNKRFKEPIDTLPIKEELLENHSLYLLQTGLEVEAFIQNQKLSLDYSPSAICLAKMFEKEISLSFVHWLRKQRQIELPEYFNRVQPGVKAEIISRLHSSEMKINLNMKNYRDGSWQAPELGKSQKLAESLTKQEWLLMGIDNSQILLSNWSDIHRVRNEAAHISKVSLKDIETLKTSLSNLANNHIFEKLSNLKESFRCNSAIY
jgi:hypothetical protein